MEFDKLVKIGRVKMFLELYAYISAHKANWDKRKYAEK